MAAKAPSTWKNPEFSPHCSYSKSQCSYIDCDYNGICWMMQVSPTNAVPVCESHAKKNRDNNFICGGCIGSYNTIKEKDNCDICRRATAWIRYFDYCECEREDTHNIHCDPTLGCSIKVDTRVRTLCVSCILHT